MASLNKRVEELGELVEDILGQFRVLDAANANGPHEDLSIQELRLLEFLGERGPKMMRELASFLLVAVNTATGTVDSLERKQLVRRLRSDEDRRVVRVELTDAGRAVYRALVSEKKAVLRIMLHALTEDEQEIFMVLFRKIARAGRAKLEAK